MPWFKVDDGLSSKAETTRIPRSHRTSAMGLWVLAGAWCAKELTDGHVPAHMIEELAGTDEDAQWLVRAGYWEVVEDGFQFVEWAGEQPLRAAVLEQRRKNTEKVSKWRAQNTPSGNRVTPAVTNANTNSDVTLPPSRPDPTQPLDTPDGVSVQPAAGRSSGSGYSSEFEEFWAEYPRKEGKGDAAKAFKAAMKRTDLPTILKAVQAYKLATMTSERSMIKMAAGWLRAERWLDEPVVTAAATTGGDGNDSLWDSFQTQMGRRPTRTERNLAVVEQYARREAAQEAARGGFHRTPTRGEENLAFLSSLGDDGAPAWCSQHPEYPNPCARCERDSEPTDVLALTTGQAF